MVAGPSPPFASVRLGHFLELVVSSSDRLNRRCFMLLVVGLNQGTPTSFAFRLFCGSRFRPLVPKLKLKDPKETTGGKHKLKQWETMGNNGTVRPFWVRRFVEVEPC